MINPTESAEFNATIVIQLALETSSRQPSIALLDGPRRVAEHIFGVAQVTTKDLIPDILTLLKRSKLGPSDIQLVSVSLGPGSFTGLRVGITTAKTLAYVNRCDLIAIGTHHLLFRQAKMAISRADEPIPNIKHIQSVIDAQRGEWFAASFCLDDPEPSSEEDSSFLVRPETLAASVDRPTLWCGPALTKLQPDCTHLANVHLAPRKFWNPMAVTCGQLAFEKLENGHTNDLYSARPYYGRKSAAEEKADLKS